LNGKSKLKEKEIEKRWNELIIDNSPLPVTIRKEKLGIGTTDGIIRFYNKKQEFLYWVLQETKRDVGINSVWFKRSILQSIMYLGNIFYDVNSIGEFKGVFLDSARYFCFLSVKTLIPLMENFEPLWNKYYRVRPSDAWRIPELNDWIQETEIDVIKFNVDDSFKLDEILNNLITNEWK
jgi:hypothetical protein